MRRSAEARHRLDALRLRLEAFSDPAAGSERDRSSSFEEAFDRLDAAVERVLDRADEPDAVAERLLAALDVIPQGIVLADERGEVVFRNREAQRYATGRHSEALVGSAIAELITGAVQGDGATRTLDLYGPPRRAIQLRAVPLDPPSAAAGDPHHVNGHGAGSERTAGAFLVVEDVSDRQRLDAVRRDFVANISHELKTPVGALGLLAETLAAETDPEVVRRLAERMQREAFRVAGTIDDLLQLSQIEAGEVLARNPVLVDQVISETVDRAAAAAEAREVRLVADPPPQSLSVLGDRRQLVSALSNLCDNAIKYSDDGADVTIACRARPDQGAVEISVADEGIGIPARDLERVFERFYRVDRARSRDTGGTGLGLAIVRHVVQNHEGEVSVVSREGEGSTFTLTLPAG
ncbi:MAG: sensor histidine kinase [Acidimicrobiales bacterium]